MRPHFSFIVDGSDITNLVNDRLVDLTLQWAAGTHNPTVSLTLDDREPTFQFPKTDATIEVWLGYLPLMGHSAPYGGMKKMGVFNLDEIECGKGDEGRTFNFKGKGVATHRSYKTGRTAFYHDMTLAQIVHDVCTRNDLKPGIHSDAANHFIMAINQGQSDMDFVGMLATKYGYKASPQNGFLYFAPVAKFKEVLPSDIVPDQVVLGEEDTTEWHYLAQGRSVYTAVRAVFYDKDRGELRTIESYKTITPGNKPNYHDLPDRYGTVKEAIAAADARKRQLDYAGETISLTTIGNPLIMPGATLTLNNFRIGVPTKWRIVEASHTLTSSGYVTNLMAELWALKKTQGVTEVPEDPESNTD